MPRFLKIIYEYFALYSSLSLLGLICLTWSVFALPLYFILPARLGTAVGRRGIMAGFRIYSWSLSITRTYRLDLKAIDTLRDGPPVILAPNHPALIDALLILTRHPNLVCVMKSALMKNVFLGLRSPAGGCARRTRRGKWSKSPWRGVWWGSSCCCSPRGTRSTRFPINPLVGSVGLIAKHANVPVQTLIIETDSPFLSKGWPLFKQPELPITYKLRSGQRFDPPKDVPAFTAELDRYYRQSLQNAPQARWLKHEE